MRTKHTIEVEVEWGVEQPGYAYVYGPWSYYRKEDLKRNYGIEQPFVPKPTQIHWIDRKEREVPEGVKVIVGYDDGSFSSATYAEGYLQYCNATKWAPIPEGE